jgi:hypothetical protein
MTKTSLASWLLAFSIGCGLAAAQDDATPPDASDGSAGQPAYDDVSQPGQIHGFIPETWTASMITLLDLQTQEGQDWLTGLTAAQSVQSQTQYVCQNPGPTTTSSDAGDFYFYDLPAGSYAIAACMQTPDGHWRSGAQVVALEAGQDDLVALGPAGGPIMRVGEPFVPAYYVALWEPMWFGPGWGWGWHTDAWQASVYYHAPLYRAAPIWVRPSSIVVGGRIFVPPYKEVFHGGYHYLAYRNGAFMRQAPRAGVVLPPRHEFHPITPEAEVHLHVGAQIRPSEVGGQVRTTGYVATQPQPTAPAHPSPFVNYHPTAPATTGATNNNAGTRSSYAGAGNIGSHVETNSQTYHPAAQVATQPHVQEPAPRQEYHAEPSPHQETRTPAPRSESHAPAPAPATQKPATQPKKNY